MINQINQLQNQQLFPFLHQNFDVFKRIQSFDDLIRKGNIKANAIIGSTIPLMIAAGFSMALK